MKIVAEKHIPFVEDYFGSYGELILKPGREIEAQDVKDADILLVRSITRVDENLLTNSRVKFVGSVTAGTDHLDTKWLDDAGIIWARAQGFNAPPVADYVVSVIAALQKNHLLPQDKLKAAVIGVGHVGKIVANFLQILHFDVLLCDPPLAENEKDFSSTPLHELHNLDLITLHVPLTKSGRYPTYHLIEQNFLKRQKEKCVLLNASRGAVIDEEDLKKFGKHLLWCLDVFQHEPNIDKETLANAIIATPHIAGYSVQSKRRGIEMIYQAACDKNIIRPAHIEPSETRIHNISFHHQAKTWQDLVLAVFNPQAKTEEMKKLLLPAKECGTIFDNMRNQFIDRYEFSATQVADICLDRRDVAILKQLGFLSLS